MGPLIQPGSFPRVVWDTVPDRSHDERGALVAGLGRPWPA